MASPSILTCEYCHKNYLPKIKRYPPGRFCSRSCARLATVAKAPPASSVDNMGHLLFRVCKACHLTKPLLSIYFKPHGKPKRGWVHTCKACHSAHKSIYNKAHRVENNRTTNAWRKANPKKWRAQTARYRANHRQQLRDAELVRRTLHALEIQRRRMLVPLTKRRTWCRQWAKANPQRRQDINARRRARIQQSPRIEKIDRAAIFLRDHWICQLCQARVNPALKYPHPGSPTLDHVIPLAEGGHHTSQNLVLAHSRCNISKRNRTRVQQMRLFG